MNIQEFTGKPRVFILFYRNFQEFEVESFRSAIGMFHRFDIIGTLLFSVPSERTGTPSSRRIMPVPCGKAPTANAVNCGFLAASPLAPDSARVAGTENLLPDRQFLIDAHPACLFVSNAGWRLMRRMADFAAIARERGRRKGVSIQHSPGTGAPCSG